MLDKTWRYKKALASYEQALQRDPGCLAALYGKGEMLSQLSHSKEELTVYGEILGFDPASTKALIKKGWAPISLRSYEEALGIFDHALQLDPSSSEPESGKNFMSFSVSSVLTEPLSWLAPKSPIGAIWLLPRWRRHSP